MIGTARDLLNFLVSLIDVIWLRQTLSSRTTAAVTVASQMQTFVMELPSLESKRQTVYLFKPYSSQCIFF